MPRNTGGAYTLPAGNPVRSGTTISSTWANGTLTDIKSALTESLSRSGNGAMLVPLKVPDGIAPQPSLTFSNDPASGLYLSAASDVRLSVTGSDRFKWTATENRSLQALKVTTGGLTVDAGGATVTAGGTASTGSAPSQGGVAGANTLEASGALSGTSGHSHALTTAAKFNAGGNVGRLNLRTQNRTTVVDWHEVRAGLSYDIDNVVGSGGSAYFSFTEGLRVTGGTTATGADPANAMELTNGNLKLSGTAPNKDVALTNTLTPSSITKLWANITTNGSGAVTLNDGENVSGVALSGGDVVITIAGDMANTTYVAHTEAFNSLAVRTNVAAKNTGSLTINAGNVATSADYDLSTNALTFDVIVVGRQ